MALAYPFAFGNDGREKYASRGNRHGHDGSYGYLFRVRLERLIRKISYLYRYVFCCRDIASCNRLAVDICLSAFGKKQERAFLSSTSRRKEKWTCRAVGAHTHYGVFRGGG